MVPLGEGALDLVDLSAQIGNHRRAPLATLK